MCGDRNWTNHVEIVYTDVPPRWLPIKTVCFVDFGVDELVLSRLLLVSSLCFSCCSFGPFLHRLTCQSWRAWQAWQSTQSLITSTVVNIIQRNVSPEIDGGAGQLMICAASSSLARSFLLWDSISALILSCKRSGVVGFSSAGTSHSPKIPDCG